NVPTPSASPSRAESRITDFLGVLRRLSPLLTAARMRVCRKLLACTCEPRVTPALRQVRPGCPPHANRRAFTELTLDTSVQCPIGGNHHEQSVFWAASKRPPEKRRAEPWRGDSEARQRHALPGVGSRAERNEYRQKGRIGSRFHDH